MFSCQVTDYFLIIDTESSGLPKNWKLPYYTPDNWPYVLQVSWILCDAQGRQVKEEDHYLHNSLGCIENRSQDIHQITDTFLEENGESKSYVLSLLQQDLSQYKPLVIGHFIELDYHLLSAEYARLGGENPLAESVLFCTMKAATLLPGVVKRSWKLTDLYWYFFREQQPNPHNALCDAQATVKCFFKERELLPVPTSYFYEQRPVISDFSYQNNTRKLGWLLLLLVGILVLIFILFFHA